MKSFCTLAGCAAALIVAGCASNKNPATADTADPPNLVRVRASTFEPVLHTRYHDNAGVKGKSFAELNKLLGEPAMSVGQTRAAGVPGFAAFSETKRLDIQKEVFYRKLGSATVMETQPARFYETVRVTRAFFDDRGVATNAVVTSVDRVRNTCRLCTPDTVCVLHNCYADEDAPKCVCPPPCGCDDCREDQQKCYRMGCVEGEPCKCCCVGACAK